MRTERANEVGEVGWTDLPFGDCRFTVSSPGFQIRTLTVTLRNGDELKLDAILLVGTVGEAIEVTLADSHGAGMASAPVLEQSAPNAGAG